MDAKYPIVVADNYAGPSPRVSVRFYLDTGDLKVTNDENGRPMVEANFEPQAAVSVLTERIMEARMRIERQESASRRDLPAPSLEYIEPYATVALLCERSMQDKADDSISAIRMVDLFYFNPSSESEKALSAINTCFVLQLRGGPKIDVVRFAINGPRGEQYEAGMVPVDLRGGDFHITAQGPIIVPFFGHGRYSVVVTLGDKRVADIPFQVKPRPVA